VATVSTGITVTFASSSAAEVTSLSWDWGNGLSQGRGVAWTPTVGTVSLELLGGISTATYGQRGTLTVAGGGMSLTCTAVCTAVGASAQVNDVTRYTAEFTILDG